MRTHARRRDANEPGIVRAFEARGCSVTRLDGKGVPDLLVGLRGRTWLVEVKKPLGPKGGLTSTRYEHLGGRGDFTSDQVDWWESWKGEKPTVVRTVADVDALLSPISKPATDHEVCRCDSATMHLAKDCTRFVLRGVAS